MVCAEIKSLVSRPYHLNLIVCQELRVTHREAWKLGVSIPVCSSFYIIVSNPKQHHTHWTHWNWSKEGPCRVHHEHACWIHDVWYSKGRKTSKKADTKRCRSLNVTSFYYSSPIWARLQPPNCIGASSSFDYITRSEIQSNIPHLLPPSIKLIFKMSDDEERVTKPFKFVTGKLSFLGKDHGADKDPSW